MHYSLISCEFVCACVFVCVCVRVCVTLVADWKAQQVGQQHFREACTLLITMWISHVAGWHLCSCVTLVRGNKDKNWMLCALFTNMADDCRMGVNSEVRVSKLWRWDCFIQDVEDFSFLNM